MCKLNEDMRNEAKRAALIETAINFLSLGTVAIEDISKATGLTLDEVKSLAEQMKPVNA